MTIKETATAGFGGLATYVMAIGFFSSAVWADPTPVLQYTFNETGSVANGTGSSAVNLAMTKWIGGSTWVTNDNHGAAGSGVSGLASDRAYHDTSLSYVNLGNEDNHYMGGFLGSHPLESVENLTALTVQGWFRTPAGQPLGIGESTLIGNMGTSPNVAGWKLATRGDAQPDYVGRLSFFTGEVEFTNNFALRIMSDPVYTETNQWIFFAMTYTPGANFGEVQYYKGTTTSAVTTAGTNYTDTLLNGAIKRSDRGFYIGNGGNEGGEWFQGRAFNGKLDNIRVYNSILTPAEIEALRQADLAPTLPAPPAAPVFASTNFNDNTAGDPIVTQGGGSGWTTKWSSDSSLTGTFATNVTVTNSGSNRAEVPTTAGTGGTAFRGLATPLADTASNTVYIHFDSQNLNDGTRFFGLALYSGTTERMLIGQGSGFTNWTINNLNVAGGTANSGIDSSTAANLLVKIVYGGQSTAETVTFWVNPNYSEGESSAANVAARIGQFTTFTDWGTIDRIRIGGGNTSGVNSWAAHWLDNIEIEASSPFASLAGDFNSDGKVDAGDYVTWRKNELANASLPNDNGLTTQANRYALWRANFGNPPGSGGTAAVPEPSALALGTILLVLAVPARVRKDQKYELNFVWKLFG